MKFKIKRTIPERVEYFYMEASNKEELEESLEEEIEIEEVKE